MRNSRGQKILSCILLLCLTAALPAGCGALSATPAADASFSAESDPETDAASDVALIEPAGSALTYVTADFHDLRSVSTCQGFVCPDITAYAYASGQPFGSYDVLPGDPVRADARLFSGASEQIDDDIEAIEEENAALLADYDAYAADCAYDLALAKKREFEAASVYQTLAARAPEEASGAYAGWAKGAMPAESAMKSARMAREKLEQAYEERTALFELESAYNETRISRLTAERDEASVHATADGVVAAAGFYVPGDSVPFGTEILAVGDPDRKEIVCDYISKAQLSKAEEVYAIIGGRRVDVVYEVMEPEEYSRRKQRGEEVYTTFHFADGAEDIDVGASAVIVVVESLVKNALCVPKDAVYQDNGAYVYRYSDGDSAVAYVSTGASDGCFVQIVSGLQAGDRVVCDVPYGTSGKSDTVRTGEVHSNFSADGYLLYPGASWAVNPAGTGACYLKELCVERFEQVTEGQVLARIEVVSDTIEIARLERRLQRQNERIADLNAERDATHDPDALETIDRGIRDRNRTIGDLNRQLEKLKEYSGIIEIQAPSDGIVTDIANLRAGQLVGYREKLVQTARDDSCYITVEDKGGLLSCGNICAVSYRDEAGASQEVRASIVTVNDIALPASMRTGYALIRVSPEDMASMLAAGSSNTGGYWRRALFHVEVAARKMEQVLLVPKAAVRTFGNDTYVAVREQEDGAPRMVNFTAGGADSANYWVACGDLTEGMTLCW